MTSLFETKIRYDKMMEDGKIKKVTEAYLVDAISFSDAEAKTIDSLTPLLSGEYTVSAIKRMKIEEIFRDEKAAKWWTIKTNLISYDDKTGKEKKTSSMALVQADDDAAARSRFKEQMKDSMLDFEISGINETNYLDFFTNE